MDQEQRCHLEGHLNTPITDDEVRFVLGNDKFYCRRHKRLKNHLKEQYPNIRPYYENVHNYWRALEEVVEDGGFYQEKDQTLLLMNIVAESSIWNLRTHHKSYYGRTMNLDEDVKNYKRVCGDPTLQDFFRYKLYAEHIKGELTETEQYMGTFHKVSQNLYVEKELTILKTKGEYYLYPTTMLMCVLDNIQSRFYVRLHVALKGIVEDNPKLLPHYTLLHSTITKLRDKYGNKFFHLMKIWEAYCIGVTVADGVGDMGFTKLKESIEKELYAEYERRDIDFFLDLVKCNRCTTSQDGAVKTSLYFANLCKNYGHPILDPVSGIKKLRENSKKEIKVNKDLAQKTLWMFRKTYTTNFFRKRGVYPNHIITGPIPKAFKQCLDDSRLPTKKEAESIPLSAWKFFSLTKNHDLSLEIDEKELLKDTACAPPREEWFRPYDPCAFKILYDQWKPKAYTEFEPRVLARYLKGKEGELAQKIADQEKGYFNHLRDDLVQLCRKEKELSMEGRVFCKQGYEQRLMQVALENGIGVNILPFIREQTMTNTELEVVKRMDKIASTISKDGNYNLNLDLSKWNQLNRHDLNKYIFKEFDELHGRKNLYEDSHHWFNRCMVLLSSRLTPPEIGPDGEPLAGDYCHYNQFGGFEGMRQKAWTVTTIMIIKLALEECNLIGNIMGQGDNQVVHLQLNVEQQSRPHFYIRMLLNTLDHLFKLGGLSLKLEETWFSKNLFEYSKIRYYKSIRIDDSLKRLNRMIPDINEGFPSLQSLITSISTITENLSRNYISPSIPFFIYSFETCNIFFRKKIVDPGTRDTKKLCAILNFPSILGGLPLSNMYQHCQRGCPDPLTIWLKIIRDIRTDSPLVYLAILHLVPPSFKLDVDPVKIVEDMYSLNLKSLPNFERKSREIIEEFLPGYVTNPRVVQLLGASRDDLTSLCEVLISMRPYIANLAHEILRNSNEGVQLQLIGSFSNLQTINRMINEDGTRGETIFSLGKIKDLESIQVIKKRLEKSEVPANPSHFLEQSYLHFSCTFKAAEHLREKSWGFAITGITSPVPCEQIKVIDYDSLPIEEKRDCIIVKTSYDLKINGQEAFERRGPFSPYLGSATPEKMNKPKLTVINPNPHVKSVMKLYYILTYLERMDNTSNLITLVRNMIQNKIAYLPTEFQTTPIEDWCGRNYGGSYEHRFKASSQKRSALYSLSENLATHVTINTNLLGQLLRGNEDYNLFFQGIFLYVQNYIAEVSTRGYSICDTYAVPLNCESCTYQIINKPITLCNPRTSYFFPLNVKFLPSSLSGDLMAPSIRLCTAAMSVAIGRKLAHYRMHDSEVHNNLESFRNTKTEDSTDRTSSNLMSEFRGANLDYVLVGALQASRHLLEYVNGESQDYPGHLLEHLAYLVINSNRLEEVVSQFEVEVGKHSTITRTAGLASGLSVAIKKYIIKNKDTFWRASAFTVFDSDLISRQHYYWRTFLCPLLYKDPSITPPKLMGIRAIPSLSGENVQDWLKVMNRDETRGLLLRFPFKEDDAIAVWRDLKGCQNEHLSPLCPISNKINHRRDMSWHPPDEDRSSEPLPSSFIFSEEETRIQGRERSPLWVKWVHHCVRPIGKISTAASKLHQVICHYNLDKMRSGVIVTLAEGSGGILNYLAHSFPYTKLIYNTLQSDVVETKENILNIQPPALVGDMCRLSERLQFLEETCLGETDITTTQFLAKLDRVLSEIGKGNVIIISMDAELKSDITNTDKLTLYLPIAAEHLGTDGLLVNKMFISHPNDMANVISICNAHGFLCNFHKPSASHLHNNEYYVVCFKIESDHEEHSRIVGEVHTSEWNLNKKEEIQILSYQTNRVSYLRHMMSHALHGLYTSYSSDPCMWRVKTTYNISEITIHFPTKRHQRNLITWLLSIEKERAIIDLRSKTRMDTGFLQKNVILSLLVLSIITRMYKKFPNLVAALDSLSVLEARCDIIPLRKLRLSLSSTVETVAESTSVLALIDHRMKDYFRTLPYYRDHDLDYVPSYALEGKSISLREIEGVRAHIERTMGPLLIEGESPALVYLDLLNRVTDPPPHVE
ncbi:MAG: RNA-dependent RNA polymerase [Hangzhou zicrona caerulea xinmovirus 1]|uniref:RNA-directed RNA polymerase L n=1 Tax=Hangzhou zicrona caerulea xinmovirus 1 TaxID=2905557 RepID=A0A8K1XCI7_9MONO|nr:MAG: RNA-dependent RNA polymerase [Hangzhou zicrona caerulea xinmovirus 1]